MLILTRKRNESIRVGEQIVIRVMRTARGSVKLGIEAPDSVRIVRGEINEAGELVVLDEGHITQEQGTEESLLLQH